MWSTNCKCSLSKASNSLTHIAYKCNTNKYDLLTNFTKHVTLLNNFYVPENHLMEVGNILYLLCIRESGTADVTFNEIQVMLEDRSIGHIS